MTSKEDIYYIVKIKEDVVDSLFYQTTIRHKFCGKLVNRNYGNFYFELNGSDALVIIPHSWIEWMAPSKKLWDMQRKAEEFVEICDKTLPEYAGMQL
mgnify:CR=1 FL=1